MLNQAGTYSAKVTYLTLCDCHLAPTKDDVLAHTLNLKVPLKINFFLCILVRNWLPSGDNLSKRNMDAGLDDFICLLCKYYEEIVAHTLFCCTCTRAEGILEKLLYVDQTQHSTAW